MAAYIVFTRESTSNPQELQNYAPKARASMKGHAGAVRAAYGRQEMLEGKPVEGVVILEFPTFEEAKAWYDSPAYREAREYRFRVAEYRAVIVQGCNGEVRDGYHRRWEWQRVGNASRALPTEGSLSVKVASLRLLGMGR